jgi:hypothetical protein
MTSFTAHTARRAAAALGLTLTCAALAAGSAHAATGSIFTVAGSSFGFGGDSGSAASARFDMPAAVATLPDGSYLISDSENNRIRRVSPAGTITTVAGGTTRGTAGDGGPAVRAELARPEGVAATADGGYLIADVLNHRIRRVSPTGVITTVAGTTKGLAGDGGAATAAQLAYPRGVAATADGGFLIADQGNNRIRKVSRNGVINTVAGSATWGLAGDGGPATAAKLDAPIGVAETRDGSILIADTGNSRIRKVAPNGVITTVAGTSEGQSGDGGPATAAQLRFPFRVEPTADGGFVISDTENGRIRRVSPGGTITTLAGTSRGLSGDGGPATLAQLEYPTGTAVTADGGLLVADQMNHRVRFVDVDLRAPARGPNGHDGAAGRTGTTGSTGAPGPQGPAGHAPAAAERLAATFGTDAFSARAGRRITLRYVATTAATVELRIIKGKRRVVRVSGSAVKGRNAIRVRAPRKAGRYVVEMTATSADGQRASDRVRLTVKR